LWAKRKLRNQGKRKLESQGKRKPGNQGKKKLGSHITYSWDVRSVREYEGVNPHIPKATPTLGD
jgi:hypothetical protein